MNNKQTTEKLDNIKDNETIESSNINNEMMFHKKVETNHAAKWINFLVNQNIMTRETALLMKDNVQNNLNIFAIWLNELSWGKFILFILLFNMCSNMILRTMNEGFFYTIFDNVTTLFIFGSIIMKIFLKNKIKSDAQIKEAQLVADKEMLQRQLAEAKIQIMQAQIEPHFLFNTLSSLDYLIMADQKKASQMLVSLVTYLRAALPQIRENQSFIELGKEIENIKAYLNIMEIRMGERLQVNYIIDDNVKKAAFPSMTLQPIVENAIKYGIEESLEGGIITISAKYHENKLEVCIADTGPGIQHNANNKGNGIALKNIKERLAMLYNNEATFVMNNNIPRGVIVKFIIPLNE